ncbi:MAG: hypothetical protein LOY03_08230 [Cyclobacteriaceae bacterium]|nr:hypothetical protein [Cyclobacteriaceae bacterium]
MPSQKNMLRLRFAAALMLLCLVSSAQPDDPNQGRRPAPRVPLTGVGWLVAAGALVGGLALRRTGIQLNSSRRHQGAKSRLRIFILVCATGQAAYAQECVSVSDGDWDVPSTWANGVVPTSGNSTSVKIHHTVTIAPGSDVSVDNLVVEDGRLVVLQGGVLQLVNGDSTDLQLIGAGALEVWGTVIGHDGISLEGLRAANTIFREGSTYEHRASGEGSIPLAQWHPQSRLSVAMSRCVQKPGASRGVPSCTNARRKESSSSSGECWRPYRATLLLRQPVTPFSACRKVKRCS